MLGYSHFLFFSIENKISRNSSFNDFKPIIRLSVFGIMTTLLFVFLVDIVLSWIYIHSLTHPDCQNEASGMIAPTTKQELLLNTQDGLSIRAWYYPHSNGSALLVMGGSGGSLGANLPPIDFLIEAGYGVLQIDSRACAQPKAPVTLGANELFDAEAGLKFLLNLEDIKSIGVFGFSMGGVTAIRTAARNPEIVAVIAEGGFYNLGKDIVSPDSHKSAPLNLFLHTIAGFFWLHTNQNPWSISPIDDIPLISPRPVFLIYGEHEANDGRALLQFDAAREPKEIWIVPNGRHGQNYIISQEEYEQRVLSFFNKHLLSKSSPYE